MTFNSLTVRNALLEGSNRHWIIACIILVIMLVGFIALSLVLCVDGIQMSRYAWERGVNLRDGRRERPRWLHSRAERQPIQPKTVV